MKATKKRSCCLSMVPMNMIDGIARPSSVSAPELNCYSSAHISKATYSNLENHPRLIRMRESKPDSKIRLDHRTGFPASADHVPGDNGKATTDKLCV
jgi:hypothetical protein